MPIALERTYRFSASHRYFRPEWSAEENLLRFGRCSWAPGHGHNYRLTVWIEGTPDPVSGFVVDLTRLDELVRLQILDQLDHRHLNEAVAEFAPGARIPSSENVALWIAAQLEDRLPAGAKLTRVRLAEEEELAAVWSAE